MPLPRTHSPHLVDPQIFLPQPAAAFGHNPAGARYILIALALMVGGFFTRSRMPPSSALTGVDALHALLAAAALALRAAFIALRARPEQRAD